MIRPTVSQAQAWRPDSLRRLADEWAAGARALKADVDAVLAETRRSEDFWRGEAADAAREQARSMVSAGNAAARVLVTASVAAQDGAAQIEAARTEVLGRVSAASSDGFAVADDGSVTATTDPSALLVALSGGDGTVAEAMLAVRAAELTRQIVVALDRLGAADTDAAEDIAEAFASSPPHPAATVPAGAWPVDAHDVVAAWPATTQDRIADQIAAMTPEQRQRLVTAFPRQVGNTDGVPWDLRVAANRVNIAQAIIDEPGTDPGSAGRIAFYRSLLAEVDAPSLSGERVDRQILAFAPDRASLIELNGDLASAKSVAVLIPGMNTTIEGSPANVATARRFVTATHGDVATITYLGGPFPHGRNVPTGLIHAADPRYALEMAPRLVTFSEDVNRTVDATGRAIPVTYIGHSYGGSILGTAEAMGLTADRTLYVAAAGAGVGVDEPADWHNRNPDVLRFSMTAPGDFIQAVQGIPGGPHGADPDVMPGVIRLATGDYDDGRPMAGPAAHSDVLNWPSDSWRSILAVITGDSETLHKSRG